MNEYDAAVIRAFLENQDQLFPKPVAEDEEEAAEFLEEVCAIVVESAKAVAAYFEEECIDLEGEDPLEAAEVFDIGDGRYLIVEA